MAINYYKELYWEDKPESHDLNSEITYPPINEEMRNSFQISPTQKDIKEALFSIGSLKVLGENGYPDFFFKKNWSMIQESLCEYIGKVWRNPKEIAEINQILIVLIPKSKHPEFISHFRPIALCNVVYKCISKILVSKLKPILHNRITPTQSSFVLERVIHDNIIIAMMMLSMKKMKGRKQFMAVKIDFEKAYD
ncbi:uncharacterized protein LOC130966906 [Arachis stenosperma]|uniref:uncharacterized protein LOC130966906 n=1 Tax=Arachis stenosperma TaxID=217475 RepID=UPI0025ABC91B|nr:uncharacterized protein LOC130966906 [Arachis stenosperma]